MTDPLATLRKSLESLRNNSAASAQYADEDQARRAALPAMRQLLKSFLDEKIGPEEFREQFDRRTRSRDEWFYFGFGGMSGGMFLNKLLKHLPQHEGELGEQLRDLLALPVDETQARSALSRFCDWIDARIVAGDSTKAALRPASASFLASAWWHVQSPEDWPVYFENSRLSLGETGLFQPIGRTVDDYFSFRGEYRKVGAALNLKSWDVEHLLDFMRKMPATTSTPPAAEPSPPSLAEPDDSEEESTQHVATQGMLVELGKRFGYQVWVPMADRKRGYKGRPLGDGCLAELPDLLLEEEAQRIVPNIDVIWIEGKRRAVGAFEVESTTSIYSGLLRLSDFVLSSPNMTIPLFLVAPRIRIGKVEAQLRRLTFHEIELHLHCRFFSIEDLAEDFEAMMKYGKDFTSLNQIARSVD